MNQDLPSFHEDLSPPENRDLFIAGMDACTRGRYTAIVALTRLHGSRGYEQLGFGNIYSFAHATAGLSRRHVNGMLRVGESLSSLRKVDDAFRTGSICWSKARLVARVATRETEDHWLDLAMRRTSTALEHLVARKAEPIVKDDYVPMPAIPLELQQRLHQLYALVRKTFGEPNLSDEDCLSRIAGLAAEQLEAIERRESTVTAVPGEHARPAQDIPALPAAEKATPRSRHIPAHIARAVLRRAGYRCETPGCGNTLGLETDHLILWSEGGTHDTKNLLARCSACHAARHRKRPGAEGGVASVA